MKIEVSIGEVLDKVSILEIKKERIEDPEKLENIQREYDAVSRLAMPYIKRFPDLYSDLKEVNNLLWDIENRIRELEADQAFNNEFIEVARSVYLNNDHRAAIKYEINKLAGSELVEEKSYK